MATNFLAHMAADNYRLERSRLLDTPVAGTVYNVIRIPRFAFVKGVYLGIDTVFGAGCTVKVGYSGNGGAGDDDYFLTTVENDPTALGWTTSVDALWFSSANGLITVTCADALGSGTGKLYVFAEYTIIH